MLVDFGKANLVEKARQQPDKGRMVLDKVKTDGLAPTLEAVGNKLEQPLALGYCNVGLVAELGAGVSAFSVGDRVVSNGKHTEVVSVPQNLCAKIPHAVSDEAAAASLGRGATSSISCGIWPGFRSMGLWRQDKGQKACAAAFVKAVKGGGPLPIPFDELVEVTRVSFEVAEAASGRA